MSLKHRVAMVTGAASGIGLACARALHREGADLFLVDRDHEALENAVLDFDGSGEVRLVQADISFEPDVELMVAKAEFFGGVEIMVNNAGVRGGFKTEDMPWEEWRRVMLTNLDGTFLCCKHVGKQMIRMGIRGSIVNMASMSGMVSNGPGFHNAHYCTSKAGVIQLTKSLAVEWAPHGIRVNAVAPGPIVTPMSDGLKANNPKLYEEFMSRIPLGRPGQPEDVAGAVVYLAGGQSSFVTGSVLVVDGGYTAW